MDKCKDTVVVIKQRDSNFELLRIVSMILIIAHHYAVHGGWVNVNALSSNNIIIQFLSMGGKLGVNCFMFITGYFLVDSKFSIYKLLKIVGEVFFYSILTLLIFIVFKLGAVNIKLIIKSLFPIIFSLYWFATAYVGLYLLSPFINELIKYLSDKKYIQLLTTLCILLSVIPTFSTSSAFMSNISWFIFLYLLAGYIKNHPEKLSNNKNIWVYVFLISYLFIFISIVAFDILGLKYQIFAGQITVSGTPYFAAINSLPILICTICLFMFFKNLNIGSKKWINTVASTTFGIYLIHDSILKNFLWEHIAKNPQFYNSKWLFLHAIIVIVIIFITGMIIDLLRINFIEKHILKYIGNNDLVANIKGKFIFKVLASFYRYSGLN